MILLARIIRWVAGAVVLLLVAGIVLHLLHANAGNGVVSTIYDADNWLVYAIVGWLIASLLVRAAVAGRGAWVRRRRGGVTTT